MEFEYYTTLKELPLKAWIEINDTKSIEYLCKNGKGETLELLKHWYSLNDEITKRFGRSDDYEEIIRKRKELALKFCDYLITGDRFKKFEAGVIQNELVDLEKPTGNKTIFEEKDLIERRCGFYLDPEKITTLEYLYKKYSK